MPPAPTTRRRRNSSRVNLVISMVFHTVIILALFYFAAREGLLGKQIKKIALEMAPKEKPPEKPKEKPPEPKVEPPKEVAKPREIPKVAATQPPRAATPPPVAAPPVAAPPPATLGGFEFEGGKQVISTTNLVELYKSQIEFAFRSHWMRPEGMSDESFVAEVQVAIDPSGKVTGNEWKKGSGNPKWDDSVKRAVGQVKALSRPPPKGFPDRFVVRFDVQTDGEAVDALSLQ